MDIEITKKNGKVYKLSDYGIVRDIVVSSPEVSVMSRQVSGRPGVIDYGIEFGEKKIEVDFKFKNADLLDYANLRDQLYGILYDYEDYYIREMRARAPMQYGFKDFGQKPDNPLDLHHEYVDGYRWLVRATSVITPEEFANGGVMKIVFTTSKLPFAESVYTSLDLDRTDFNYDLDTYGAVDRIYEDYRDSTYTSSPFYLWNAGNVRIYPGVMDIVITIEGLTTTGGFVLMNSTSKTWFQLNKAVTNGKLVLNGTSAILNGVNVLRHTNKQFVELVPEYNYFTTSNGTFSKISFDFRYYKL